MVAEVRSALGVHKEGTFSKSSLLTYIEGLHLTLVSPSMATQVLLALLVLDLGEGPCDVTRFVTALSAPPAWETSELAAGLWGSLGESAASVVQQTRRKSRGRARTGTDSMTSARRPRCVTAP